MTPYLPRSMYRQISILLPVAWIVLLAACGMQAASPHAGTASPEVSAQPALPALVTQAQVSPTNASTPLPKPTATSAPLSTPTAGDVVMLPTPVQSVAVCSPLQGYTLAQLAEIVSNPYDPPGPGSDDPHQGVDLADRLPGTGIAGTGMPVQAILSGSVVLAQTERFPYGSAVIIETSLDDLPAEWQAQFPAAAAPSPADPALTCPVAPLPDWQNPQRSLYVLYGHLLATPLVQAGQSVSCGQQLGAVGQSGNALVPHLHLELRVGPSGWQPIQLAHYTNDATADEMSQYCTWRVSGIFQHLDPLKWLAQTQK